MYLLEDDKTNEAMVFYKNGYMYSVKSIVIETLAQAALQPVNLGAGIISSEMQICPGAGTA